MIDKFIYLFSFKGHKGTLAIVSHQEFKELQVTVQDLQIKFETESPDFPENIKFMKELRERGASLTDAITALKLSARLEAAEKAIENITEMLTDLTRVHVSTFELNAVNKIEHVTCDCEHFCELYVLDLHLCISNVTPNTIAILTG